MLRLKLPTDPRWVNIVEKNISEILTDHAWCEQKAATNAITLITLNPEYTDMVNDLMGIVREELDHFDQVRTHIEKRGLKLGRERKDAYVGELYQFINKTGNRNHSMVDRLLFTALIEARSCERFKVLAENIQDPELAAFYNELMESEAGHYTTYIGHARKYAVDLDVEKRWQEWLAFEASIIVKYGKKETVHG